VLPPASKQDGLRQVGIFMNPVFQIADAIIRTNGIINRVVSLPAPLYQPLCSPSFRLRSL
jgi:hypothetical protein